jgi:hypothetical protein
LETQIYGQDTVIKVVYQFCDKSVGVRLLGNGGKPLAVTTAIIALTTTRIIEPVYLTEGIVERCVARTDVE